MAELAESLHSPEEHRLDQAEGVIRGYCGWHISPSRTETHTFRGNCSRVIALRSLHVTAVTSVTADGAVLDSTSYDWTENGVLTRADGGWWTERAIVVTFTHGYPIVPPEVTAAVQAVALNAIDNPKALKSWTRGPFAESYGDAAATRDGLENYRIVSVS